MPGSTPIYGFPYPEATDLVADYPALGQELAEDIEAALPTVGGLAPATPTSIANSGGSASLSGNTVTFTGVSSVSLNGCFTGDYDNYRVIVYSNSSSTSPDLILRNRASGTDDSSANYTYQRSIIRPSVSATQTVNGTSMPVPQAHNGYKAASVIEVLGPNLTQPTVYLCSGFNSYLSGTTSFTWEG